MMSWERIEGKGQKGGMKKNVQLNKNSKKIIK